MVMRRVASVAGVGWVAVRIGPVGGVPAVGAVVVLMCVWDMLGRVIVVVVMVGRWVLHVAVLGMVPVHQCRGWALGGPQVRGRLRRSRGRVGLGRELPPLTPE